MQGGFAPTENAIMSGATDLFRPSIQEVSLTNRYRIKVRAMHDTKDPWGFTLPSVGNSYTDLQATRLNVTYKVTGAGGEVLTDADNVAVVNMMGTSLISRVDISIGGRTIPDLQTMHYNYKAYIEAILSFSSSAKASQLRCVGWFGDEPASAYEDFSPTVLAVRNADGEMTPGRDSANTGYVYRKNLIKGSRLVQTCWPLQCDFFQMGTYLPPDTQLVVTLHKASDDFLLLTGQDVKKYKVVVTDIFLEFCFVDVAPNLHESNMARLLKEPMCAPENVTQFFTKPIGVGPKNLRWDITSGGVVPKKVIIVFIDSDGFNGSQQKNPYLFQCKGLNYLQLRVNSRSYPDEAYTPDFDKELCMREYRGLFDNIGFANDDAGNSVTYDQFLSGMTMFPFDLTEDWCNGYHSHGPKYTGCVTLDARFNADMKNVTVMAILSWDGHLLMDQALNCWVDRG